MLEYLLRYTPPSFFDGLVRRPGFARLVEQLVLRLVDQVIVVVDESRDRLLKAGVAPDRLTVVCNTPRLDQWQATEVHDVVCASRGAESLRLLYLGNLDGSRGVDVVIRAVRTLSERNRPVLFHVI